MRLLEEFDLRIESLLLFLELWTMFLPNMKGVQKLLLISENSLLSSLVSCSALSSFLLNLLITMDMFWLLSHSRFLFMAGVRRFVAVFLLKSSLEFDYLEGLSGMILSSGRNLLHYFDSSSSPILELANDSDPLDLLIIELLRDACDRQEMKRILLDFSRTPERLVCSMVESTSLTSSSSCFLDKGRWPPAGFRWKTFLEADSLGLGFYMDWFLGWVTVMEGYLKNFSE